MLEQKSINKIEIMNEDGNVLKEIHSDMSGSLKLDDIEKYVILYDDKTYDFASIFSDAMLLARMNGNATIIEFNPIYKQSIK